MSFFKFDAGSLDDPTNDVFEGPCDENGLPHGEGKLIMAVGCVATGTFVHGKQQGHGRVEGGGMTYEGEIKDNMYHGFGKFELPAEGQYYAGDWAEDRPHGIGIMKGAYGTYKGEFVNGEFHGDGMIKWDDGSIEVGVFAAGLRCDTRIEKKPTRYAMSDLF